MTAMRSSRRVYSAEELRRLRSTASQPALQLSEAIEEHDGEDAELVKEHVLRGSKSWAARSWKSRASGNSLRVPANKENRSTTASEAEPHVSFQHAPKPAIVLGEIAPNNQALRSNGPWRPRPSPTPSLRRKKIESLVKAHGSPTHVRVTAGGRIVPSDQSPLCHPRFGYSAIKTNGGLVKFAPNHPVGNAQWTQATQNGFVAQDVNGRLCQIVDGTVLPLNEIDGALQLFMPAPNLNITRRGPSLSAIPGPFGPNGNPQQRQSSRIVPPEPSVTAQLNALELEYSKLEHELRDVDKTEVLHGRTMGKAARDALIGKRRELVVTLDNIRRALKGLKEQVPASASTSDPATQQRQSISPPKSRLPGFLQQRRQNQSMVLPPAPPALYGPFYAAAQPPPFPAPFGFQPTPSPESAVSGGYTGQPWAMPPPAMFMPPHPFDGSMSTTSLPYRPDSFSAPGPFQAPRPEPVAPAQAPQAAPQLAQNDGARSFADLQKVSPPPKSHALPIKAPESKGLKSVLNPMSPVYQPGTGLLKGHDKSDKPSAKSIKDRAPTPLSPLHQLQPPSTGPLRVVNTTDEAISPTKKSALLHSSSIASFDTADFFPRNTREYSTRRHAYTTATDQSSEDKENMDPQRHDSKQDERPITPGKERAVTHGHPVIVQSASSPAASPPVKAYPAPIAPPGTPVDAAAAMNQQRMPQRADNTTWERQSHGFDVSIVPDREVHNLSPKAKRRDWLFVEEQPGLTSNHASSSPERYQHACQDELCVTSSPYDEIDFLRKPRDFVEGYQSGLNRNPPGFDRSADFLEGYCAALMKAKAPSANMVPSTGSPVKPAARRPSPVGVPPQSSGGLQTDRRPARPTLAPFETNVQSMDTLKQAVFAPHNENAILTPAADGPHVNEAPFNLGAWAKSHDSNPSVSAAETTALANALQGFQFPQRTTSMANRQLNVSSEDHVGPMNETKAMVRGQKTTQGSDTTVLQTQHSGNQVIQQPSVSPTISAKSIPSSNATSTNGQRISSMTSIDSNLYRNWPGHRVFSPHLEWKSASSVAQHTGLANGAFFAHAQFDGASDNATTSAAAVPLPGSPLTQSHTTTIGAPASQQTQRPTSIMSDTTGMPQQYSRFREGSIDGMSSTPNSPQPMSPPMSPKMSPGKQQKMKESPSKSASPARATIEHIAGKVGIKASSAGATGDAAGGSPTKRRGWRDVWRGGSRKESSKDEMS